ncbi:MAG: hypothetical protein WKF83_16735 [Nocardioidaceae bacterium]
MSADVARFATKEEVLAAYDDRFLRWQVTSTGFQSAWVSERAAVIHRLRGTQPQLITLGGGPEIGVLLELAAGALLDEQLADGSVRLTIEAGAAKDLPAGIRLDTEETDAWEWMWTRDEPPLVRAEEQCTGPTTWTR